MKLSKSYKFIMAVVAFVLCCVAMPVTLLAYDSADEFTYLIPPSQLYYGDDTEQWYCSDSVWYKCDVVENNSDISTTASKFRDAMLDKKTTYSLKVAIKDSISAQGNIDGKIEEYIYSMNGITSPLIRAKCGDYLKYQSTENILIERVGQASNQNPDYEYYIITLTATYDVSKDDQVAIDNFYAMWQSDFIYNNAKINSTYDADERQYYIVKTIYNFAVGNICYDRQVYENVYSQDSDRYKVAHSLYGATFGNLADGASNYIYSFYIDSNGLTRIKTANQGLAVCDGYSYMIYYLCQLNGIDCHLIHGDYPNSSPKYSDPHAWNVVKLCDNNESNYKWFYIDATFASNSFSTLKNLSTTTGEQVNLVDYDYFLRGCNNEMFSNPNHQLPYEYYHGKVQTIAQQNDYSYRFSHIDTSSSWVIVSRRPVTNSPLEIENYHFISPDGKIYKINDSHVLEECANTMSYDGTEYYYSVRVQDYAPNMEYTFETTVIKDAGKYSLLYSIDGTNEIPVQFEVLKLDMSLQENYNEVLWQGDDIHNLDSNHISKVPFTGTSLSFSVSIKDKNDYTIPDFDVYISDMNGNVVNDPTMPGSYKIIIDFNREGTNYTGQFVRRFDIVKSSMSDIRVNASELSNLRYGENLLSGSAITSINNIPFYEGVDYSVAVEDASKVNYGDEGYLVYTALPTSSYFIEGTQLRRYYKINRQLDISSQFDGKQIPGLKYTYSGSPIVPESLTLNIILNGETYSLVQGRDYVIKSCRNNVEPGTAYVKVNFIGNFTGTAEMSFIIEPKNSNSPSSNSQANQSANKKDIKIYVQDTLKYTGKPLNPEVKVTCNNVTLVKGKDYTVSSIGYQPGAYKLSVNGLGEYSSIKSQYVVFVEPGKVTGISATASSNKIDLKWASQGSMVSYEIYCYDTAKKKWTLIGKTNKSSFKVSYVYSKGKKKSIAYNKNYKFKIRAYYNVDINGVKYSKRGEFKEFTALCYKKAPTLKSLKKGKKQLTAYWSKYSNISGYEVQYSTDKKFKKNNKTVSVSNKKTNLTVKKLKAKKTYYVRVRAYKKIKGVKVYTGYSAVKKIKL